MDFSTPGTDGPRPDAAAVARAVARAELADNVWGSLFSAVDAQRAAARFHSAGWRVRRSSRTEFEVESAFAELRLLPLEPVTFSGFVDPDRIDALLAALEAMGLSFDVEFTDADGRDHLQHSANQSN
ncbi:hypothetical protein ACGF13_20340 [Kitasatospora sp. NPDC048286]|uniref:hypothetical protein n=1 Tax=unclassified Kitasatospora TaxID=2633591 RepID=UPI00371FB712